MQDNKIKAMLFMNCKTATGQSTAPFCISLSDMLSSLRRYMNDTEKIIKILEAMQADISTLKRDTAATKDSVSHLTTAMKAAPDELIAFPRSRP